MASVNLNSTRPLRNMEPRRESRHGDASATPQGSSFLATLGFGPEPLWGYVFLAAETACILPEKLDDDGIHSIRNCCTAIGSLAHKPRGFLQERGRLVRVSQLEGFARTRRPRSGVAASPLCAVSVVVILLISGLAGRVLAQSSGVY